MIISIFHCESGSFAMQNLRFYRVKQPLLERKTIGFGLQKVPFKTLTNAF